MYKNATEALFNDIIVPNKIDTYAFHVAYSTAFGMDVLLRGTI
jgi:hypothetical protein